MLIQELRALLGCTKKEFALRYNIPFRTIQNWELGERTPPEYVMQLLEEKVKKDVLNNKCVLVHFHFPDKKNLPSRRNCSNSVEWLKKVQYCLGDDFIFALDDALMCEQLFLGRHEEVVVWGYGNVKVEEYKGVVRLGDKVDDFYVKEKNNLLYTNFNRTIIDSLDNQNRLDMQGITEALSCYYYTHNETFSGLYIDPDHLTDFKKLSVDAIEYYNS